LPIDLLLYIQLDRSTFVLFLVLPLLGRRMTLFPLSDWRVDTNRKHLQGRTGPNGGGIVAMSSAALPPTPETVTCRLLAPTV
jgi:hypothetical protein